MFSFLTLVNQHPGPLPIKGEFNFKGEAVFFLSGTRKKAILSQMRSVRLDGQYQYVVQAGEPDLSSEATDFYSVFVLFG